MNTGLCNQKKDSGFALVVVLFMITVLAVMTSTYMTLAQTELKLAKSTKDSASGFNAAELGLNLRAEEIRLIFEDYSKPSGTSPTGIQDCDEGILGSGDFDCRSYTLSNNHEVTTFVTEEAGNPLRINIPPTEPFAGLNAEEYRYTVSAVGRNKQRSNEAILDLTFKSRVVPMFQFAIFFKEDLEFFNGASMEVSGAVHTNGDLYLAPQTGGSTDFTGQITVRGDMYRGQKSQNGCSGYTGTVRVKNPAMYASLPGCASNRRKVTDVTSWNDNIDIESPDLALPDPAEMNAFTGDYWNKADLRIVLRLLADGSLDTTNSNTGVEIVNIDGSSDIASTNTLHSVASCPGSIQTGGSGPSLAVGTKGPGTSGEQLRLYREYQHSHSINDVQRVLDIDMRALLNCIDANPEIMDNRGLDDLTEEGLVFHFTIDGPDSAAAHNNYSIRVSNAATLQSNRAGAARVRGITVVSDQGVIVWGDYNAADWIPAALMGDTIWLLSNSWDDSIDTYQMSAYQRSGDETTVEAAVITGIARTGGANGAGGRDRGANSNGGGVINFMRFNEWFRSGSGTPDFNYRGSIVSLGPPRHSESSWGPFTYYSAPNRNWAYDTRFNNPDLLPPMTPVFVYNRQELFVRDYDL